ncbi:MAG TPA: hypothetical protein VMV18_10390 [bacterium]|nr:hypothetical protein [bacterium]
MNRTVLSLAVTATSLAVVAVFAGACSKKSAAETSNPLCDDGIVPYGGYSTDEACGTLLDAIAAATPTMGGAHAPVIATPTSGAGISMASSSLTITFTSPIDTDGDTMLRQKLPSTRFAKRAPRAPHVLQTILDAVNPVSTAWAHLAPMTGALHMVMIMPVNDAMNPQASLTPGMWKAFTTQNHFTLTGNDFMAVAMQSTSTQIHISIIDAYMTQNEIVTPATDGPFQTANDTIVHAAP